MNKKEIETVGIRNEGKENQFLNNKFKGFDIGLHDKGEKTVAKGNEFYKSIDQYKSGQVKWHHTWWGGIIIGVIVSVIATLIVLIITKFVSHI